jgi:hypothetical protein
MARTVLGLSVVQAVGQQFSLNGARRLEIAKTNLGPYPEPLGVALVEEDETTRFEYGEAPSGSPETKRGDCQSWLIEFLQENGATKPADVVCAAGQAGFSERTVYRARKALGDLLTNSDGHRSPRNEWYIEEDAQD